MNSCSYNYLGYLVRPVDHPLRVTEGQSQTETIKTSSQADPNISLVSVRLNHHSIFYSPYTAGYTYLSLQQETVMDVSLRVEPVPLSFVTPSAFEYDQLDLNSEKLTGLIFMKAVADLEAHEFIRSPIFRFYFDNYEYNHFLTGPFEFTVAFNKLRGYPDSEVTPEELDRLHTVYDLDLDVSDPANFYCLANYNELTRTWSCISRNVLSVSENKIEFAVVTTGVFAVIYCPRIETATPQFCGFVCQYKKEIMTALTIVLPILLIVGGFIWGVALASYRNLKEKIQFVNTDENDVILKPAEEAPTDDETVAVETARHAYNNPLLFEQEATGSDLEALEQTKMKLRFKDEKLMAEKLQQLRKNVSLRNEVEAMRESIALMQRLRGDTVFEREGEDYN